MNYYERLHVSPNADMAVISAAFKTLAKKFHPDVAKGDPEDTEKIFKEINEAYQVLSDPELRQKYDDVELANSNSKKQKKADDRQLLDGWDIVEEYYPDLEEYRVILSNLNESLALAFQYLLLDLKEFELGENLYESLYNNYMIDRFGESIVTRELGEYLLYNDFFELADELERQIQVLGPDHSKSIVKKIKADNFFEIYGQSIEELQEWLDYFEDYIANLRLQSSERRTSYQFKCSQFTSLMDSEFELYVNIYKTTHHTFKGQITNRIAHIKVDVLFSQIHLVQGKQANGKSFVYEDDEEAFGIIDDFINKIIV